ncbi:MAG: hypothetical protein ACK5LY_04255 [Lachnospirales bacterium]
MKKFIIIMMSLVLCSSIVSCSQNDTANDSYSDDEEIVEIFENIPEVEEPAVEEDTTDENSDVTVCEMVYATSIETSVSSMIDSFVTTYPGMTYTYENNVATILVPNDQIETIRTDLAKEKEMVLQDTYISSITNDIYISADCKIINVDFTSEATEEDKESVINGLINLSGFNQTFNEVPSDEFYIGLNIFVDGVEISSIAINKEELAKS